MAAFASAKLGSVSRQKVNNASILLIGASLSGSIERFGYKIRKRLQRLVAIRNAEPKSAQEVIRPAMGIGAAVLKSQRNLEASSFGIGHWLFESKMGGEVLMATSRPAIGAPRRIIFAVDQKLGRTDDSFIFVRSAPRFAERLLVLGRSWRPPRRL